MSEIPSKRFRIMEVIDFKSLYDQEKLHRHDHVWITNVLKETLKSIINSVDDNNRMSIQIQNHRLPFSSYDVYIDIFNINNIISINTIFDNFIAELPEFILYIKEQNIDRMTGDTNFYNIYCTFKEQKEIHSAILIKDNNDEIIKKRF